MYTQVSNPYIIILEVSKGVLQSDKLALAIQ